MQHSSRDSRFDDSLEIELTPPYDNKEFVIHLAPTFSLNGFLRPREA